MQTAAALLLAYLVGSIDFGVIVPRLLGIDIYNRGSGNPGTSNVLRTVGKKAAGAVMLGDSLKGLAAAALGDLWHGEAVGFACALAAVVGHIFPVWHRFRGGRGVATAIGTALWLEPLVGLALAAIWIGLVLGTKVASVASLVAIALYVPGMALFEHRQWSLLWAALLAAVVIGRHYPNILRLVRGEERTVGSL